MSAARPECIVLSPAGAVWEQRSLLVLHWRSDTARSFVEHWRPLVDEGWTLVAPQSSQVCDATTFCWDDADLALREIRQHLDDCRRLRGMDLGGMVIAGASQGARLALELAVEAGLPALCVIPSFPEGYDVSRLTSMAGHVPVGFILGERDPASERARQVITTLESAGVPLVIREMKGIGHDLPEGFASVAGELLGQLVDAGRSIPRDTADGRHSGGLESDP
jgi:predicted esterase